MEWSGQLRTIWGQWGGHDLPLGTFVVPLGFPPPHWIPHVKSNAPPPLMTPMGPHWNSHQCFAGGDRL